MEATLVYWGYMGDNGKENGSHLCTWRYNHAVPASPQVVKKTIPLQMQSIQVLGPFEVVTSTKL